MKLPKYDWLWVLWVALFFILESIGLVHNAVSPSADWTLTHFLSSVVPIGVRAAILAWLAWHFLVEHKAS